MAGRTSYDTPTCPIPRRSRAVVVDVLAASVNGADWKVRAGNSHRQWRIPLPWGGISPEWWARSATASTTRVGDPVFGVLDLGQDGAYAEKIAIKAAIVTKKPETSMSHPQAAALALTGGSPRSAPSRRRSGREEGEPCKHRAMPTFGGGRLYWPCI